MFFQSQQTFNQLNSEMLSRVCSFLLNFFCHFCQTCENPEKEIVQCAVPKHWSKYTADVALLTTYTHTYQVMLFFCQTEGEQQLGKLEFTHHIYEEYQPIFPRESKPPIILQSIPQYSVANYFTINKQHPYPQHQQLGSHLTTPLDPFHHQQVCTTVVI